MEHIYSTGQDAKILGVRRHRIEYAIATGHLAEARFRFLDKRCFDGEDVRRMAEFFGVEAGLHLEPTA